MQNQADYQLFLQPNGVCGKFAGKKPAVLLAVSEMVLVSKCKICKKKLMKTIQF
jgi:hypothetical protein